MHWSNEGYEQESLCKFSKTNSWLSHTKQAHLEPTTTNLTTILTPTSPFPVLNSQSPLDEIVIYLENNELNAVLKTYEYGYDGSGSEKHQQPIYIRLTNGKALWGNEINGISNHYCNGKWRVLNSDNLDDKISNNSSSLEEYESSSSYSTKSSNIMTSKSFGIATLIPDDVLISNDWKSMFRRDLCF